MRVQCRVRGFLGAQAASTLWFGFGFRVYSPSPFMQPLARNPAGPAARKNTGVNTVQEPWSSKALAGIHRSREKSNVSWGFNA